ncbi:MAG: hypothetical protein ACJ8F7_08505 [Gemmataceae bacterium]
MSTAPTPPAPAPAPMRNMDRSHPSSEITIFSHSTLFYWWPVWILAFAFALISAVEGTRALYVPSDTKVELIQGGAKLTSPNQNDLEKKLRPYSESEGEGKRRPPRVSDDAGLGTLFLIILLVVIGITSVPLRGLWSVLVIVIIVLVSVILAILHAWDWIFNQFSSLRIYMGFAGYLFFAIVLCIMWGMATFLYDHQVYIVFSPGQMKVCQEIGGGEQAYDTSGMTIEKHRDDLFRHWVLGLGSGDLTVRTSGAQAHTITMPNVLFISRKLKQIEDMQREKQIV